MGTRRWMTLLLFAALPLSGCAWQHLPPYASAVRGASPERIAVKFVGGHSSEANGRRVVAYLREWKAFESVVEYDGTSQGHDKVLTLEVDGGLTVPAAANNARLFLVGMSLGAASPWVGMKMNSDYNLTAMLGSGDEVERYTARTTSDVSYGLAADETSIAYEVVDREMSWLAWSLARQLRERFR